MFVSLTEITADQVKKKKEEEDPRPASQTNWTKVVSKQEVSRKQHLIQQQVTYEVSNSQLAPTPKGIKTQDMKLHELLILES